MTEGLAPASAEDAADTPAARLWRWAPLSAALVTASLASLRLGDASIQPDEAGRIAGARRPLGALWDAARADDITHLTTHLLWKPWLGLVGTSEEAARAPSLVLAAVAAALVVLVGAELLGRLAGIVAGLALATNGYVLDAAVTVGPPALALALAVLSTYALLRAVRSDAPAWWALHAAAAIAIATVDLASATVVVAHAAYLAVRRPPSWRHASVALGVVAVALAAWLALVSRSGAWALDWLPEPSARSVGEALWQACGRNPVLVAAAAGGLLAVAGGWTRARAVPTTTLLGLWLALPVLAPLAVSLWRPAFAAPFLIASAAALALLAGAAAAAVEGARLAAGLLAVGLAALGIGGVVSVARFLEPGGRVDWREASLYVLAARSDRDDVLVTPADGAPAFSYYAPGVAVARAPRSATVWVVATGENGDRERRAGRAAVGAPAYALLEERSFGDRVMVQRWLRT